MDSRQQDYIKKLYLRFYRESVSGNPSSESYSEEELLDIFDYAGDMGDDYTQLMVLLKARTDYPDDPELMARRGIFLTFNTGGTALSQDFLDSHTHDSALWDIMRIYNLKPSYRDATAMLDKMLSRFDEIDDEAVIRMVDVIAELNLFDWFMANLDALKAKVMYPETLLHEAAEECIGHGLTDRAIALLVELTEIEPFDPLYWRMLAEQYIVIDNFTDALKAVDYALAIDGKDLETLMLKAQILFDLSDTRHDEAIQMMERLCRKNPDESRTAFLLAQMLTLVGRTDESRAIVTRFLDENPLDVHMIQSAMLLHDDELSRRILSRYLDNDSHLSDEAIESYADHLTEVKCVRESAILQYLWYRRHRDTRLVNRTVFGLYLYGFYDEVCEIILHSGEFPVVNLSVMGPTEWSMSMLALARCHHTNALLSLTASMVSVDLARLNPGLRLSATAAIAIAATLSDLIDAHGDNISADDLKPIDPFQSGMME